LKGAKSEKPNFKKRIGSRFNSYSVGLLPDFSL
jgi:hypothetical protein